MSGSEPMGGEMPAVSECFAEALRLHRRGELRTAEVLYRQVLASAAGHAASWHLLGVLALQQGDLREGCERLSRAVEADPLDCAAHGNLGVTRLRLGEPEAALASFDRALSLVPEEAQMLFNRSAALHQLARHAEALESIDQVLTIQPEFVGAHLHRGNILCSLKRFEQALRSLDIALTQGPEDATAHVGRGDALQHLDRLRESVLAYEQALRVRPDWSRALEGLGAALAAEGRPAEAARCYERLHEVAPETPYAQGTALHYRANCCDWRGRSSAVQQLIADLAAHKPAALPFQLLAISDAAPVQLKCARAYAPPLASRAPLARAPYGHDRIRVAYVSGDFGPHPVGRLLAALLEHQDRKRFASYGIALRPAKGEVGERLRSGFDEFIEVQPMSDLQIATLLRDLEIDIAVDLMGYTRSCRPDIFAYRAAPAQVSYLGYAGTLGSSFMDYLIADDVVIAPGEEIHYSEQVVRLPRCYLPAQPPPEVRVPSRAELGLPADEVVFCGFTKAFKINPPLFDVWCALLQSVPASVLWLLDGGGGMRANLLREAASRGVSGERLVFARYVAGDAEHIARQAAADLFLDTLPYNAHSTACDALAAGVPILTCAGGAFAARVAASALAAIGLPELIAENLEQYLAMGVALVRDRDRLAALKRRLRAAREHAPLFDLRGYCVDLEAAFERIWERSAGA